MRKLKYVVVVLLVVALVATSVTIAHMNRTGNQEANAAGSPINTSWNPVYIDDQAETPLSKADLVKEISPAVVSITTQTLSYNAFLQPVPQSGAASGVIIDPKGYIVTNNHVVDGAESLKVTLNYVDAPSMLSNGLATR